MPSYIKNQWFHLLVAVACFVLAIISALQMPDELTTIENINDILIRHTSMMTWAISGCIWFFSSIINHHQECIDYLEKKIETLGGKEK